MSEGNVKVEDIERWGDVSAGKTKIDGEREGENSHPIFESRDTIAAK